MYVARRYLCYNGIIVEGPFIVSPRYCCVVPIVFRTVV